MTTRIFAYDKELRRLAEWGYLVGPREVKDMPQPNPEDETMRASKEQAVKAQYELDNIRKACIGDAQVLASCNFVGEFVDTAQCKLPSELATMRASEEQAVKAKDLLMSLRRHCKNHAGAVAYADSIGEFIDAAQRMLPSEEEYDRYAKLAGEEALRDLPHDAKRVRKPAGNALRESLDRDEKLREPMPKFTIEN